MTNIYKHSEESGRSMVEMLGVLAIVGVLSIGGIAGYTKAMAKYKINSTLDQISMLVTNIRSTFGNQPTYEGLNNATAVTYGLVDSDLSHSTNSTLTNAFGGPVTLGTDSLNGVDNAAFTIQYQQLPASACATIASADWGGTAASGLSSIKVNETTFTFANQGLPMTFNSAATACAGDNATITWTYF